MTTKDVSQVQEDVFRPLADVVSALTCAMLITWKKKKNPRHYL
jgi:hypothetical protein